MRAIIYCNKSEWDRGICSLKFFPRAIGQLTRDIQFHQSNTIRESIAAQYTREGKLLDASFGKDIEDAFGDNEDIQSEMKKDAEFNIFAVVAAMRLDPELAKAGLGTYSDPAVFGAPTANIKRRVFVNANDIWIDWLEIPSESNKQGDINILKKEIYMLEAENANKRWITMKDLTLKQLIHWFIDKRGGLEQNRSNLIMPIGFDVS